MSRIAFSLAPFLLLTGLAAAQTSPTTPAPGAAATPSGTVEPAHGTKGHREREHEGLQNVKISLTQALDTAESKGPGRAFEADFETGGGKPYYEVMVLGSDGKLTDHHIDANSGQVIKSDNHPIESYFGPAQALRRAECLHEPEAGGRDRRAEGGRQSGPRPRPSRKPAACATRSPS